MRIGINAHFINNPFCGSGQYLISLLKAMKKIAPENEYLVFESPYQSDLGQVFWEQMYFPFLCWKNKVDLAFVPYFAPPLFISKPVVITVHDIFFSLFPQKSLKIKLYNFLIQTSLRFILKRVCTLMCDSQKTYADLVNALSVDREKIKVIQLANTLKCNNVLPH